MESALKKVKVDETYEEYFVPTCEFCQALKNKPKDWAPYMAAHHTFCKTHAKMVVSMDLFSRFLGACLKMKFNM